MIQASRTKNRLTRKTANSFKEEELKTAYRDGKQFWSIYGEKINEAAPFISWWQLQDTKIVRMHQNMYAHSMGEWNEWLRGCKEAFDNDPQRAIAAAHERY